LNRKKFDRASFKILAERRTQQAILYITNLASTSNREIYEYTEDDIKRCFNRIDKALEESKKTYQKEMMIIL
jgi:retron-type reverse transcriptase